jgi:hypothetical protein
MRRVFQPVHLGHADVHHDDVGIACAYLFDRLSAGRGLADYLDVLARVEQCAERITGPPGIPR